MANEENFGKLRDALKKAGAALRDAGVPFLLAGGLASWARGGPQRENDVDLMVKPEDADKALLTLEAAGMRPVRPPEEWLVKAYDDDVLVDVIFCPAGYDVDDAMFERADEIEVAAMTMKVIAAADLLGTKLMALTEHELRLEPCLEIARALREQVDWDTLRSHTSSSPFAKAFFVIVDELGISDSGVPEAERAPVDGTDGHGRDPHQEC